MIEIPFWTVPLIFILGLVAGIFVGWYLYSVTRLAPAPEPAN